MPTNHSSMTHSEHMAHTHGGEATFAALWSPGLMLITLLLCILYWYVTGPAASRFKGGEPVGLGKQLTFYTAALLFYAAEGSPIGYYGHAQSFAMHMSQMSLLYLIIPPLVLLALPSWLLRPVLERPAMRKWVYPLTHPLLAIFLFNMAFSFYHIPQIFSPVFEDVALHWGYHLLLVVLAFQMWFPVFCPVPEWNRLSELQKMAYIFGNGVLLTPACALIIFADDILYPQFVLPDTWLPYFTPLDDQQLGGTIMKILQEVIYGTALAYIFFKWYRKERKKEDDDLNPIPGLHQDPAGTN